jgi:hypothetical protein
MDMMVIPNRVRLVAVMSALALALGLLTLALLAKPTQAQAQTEHFDERAPLSLQFEHPCTGEEIFLEGFFHTSGTVTRDAAGNLHVQVHSTFVGQGVSITSGAKYVAHEVSSPHFNVRDTVDPAQEANFTDTLTFHFIRQGSPTPEDDFMLFFLNHLTVNPNNEVTSDVLVDRVECK